MPFGDSPGLCTRVVCSFATAAVLTQTFSVDPRPVDVAHHEVAHVQHVPEPDYSTEPVDPNDNASPGPTAAPPAGYYESLRRWGLGV